MRNANGFTPRIARWLIATALCVLSAPTSLVLAAESPDGVWGDVAEAAIARTATTRSIVPQRYRTVQLDRAALEATLRQALPEDRVALNLSAAQLHLPLPDGKFGRFRIAESPVMEAALAERYPDIRTWIGQGIDDPSATLRFDVTPKGFHAQIISWEGTSYIDPFQPGDQDNYIAYRKADYDSGERPRCEVTGEELPKDAPDPSKRGITPKVSSGATLRTYRLAMAATGEYTTFHGGTVADGLAAQVTTMNRVNGIYEREVSVRMILVANNDLIVYTNPATDPYANSSGDLTANQNNINAVIGSANYDVGHLVGTGGGGVAGLGVICTSSKARGLTGSGSPVGDAFDVDYVAHEMGHQFSGNHTFNGSGGNCSGGNRNGSTAYEPGSGITIQAYAGICSADNTQPNSEDYFHRVSLNEILAHTTSGSGSTCGTTNATGNGVPTVTTAATVTIPRQTPFELTAVGVDGDGDTLTYLWEQFNLGTANSAGVLTDNGGPLFRSFTPTLEPTRVFPSLRYILNNANVAPASAPLPGTTTPNYFTAELLPNTNRTMNFRVTVRDNRAAGGGTNEASTAVTVTTSAGPFNVTAPNTAVSWAAGSAQTVTWNVANTNLAPVNTANVRITLSLDGGYTWPVELAASAPNNGSAAVTIPANTPASTQARVRVSAVGNIYFDVSDSNFTITGANTPPSINVTGSVSTRQGSPAANGVVASISDTQDAAGSLAVSVSGAPPELLVSVVNNSGSVSLTATALCTLVAPTGGNKVYPVLLQVTDSAGAVTTASVNVNVASNQVPTLGNYTSLSVGRSSSTPVSPSAGPNDPNGNFSGMSVSPTTLPGGGTLSIAPDGTVTVVTTASTTFGTYPVRASAFDSCGATEMRQFNLTVAGTSPVLNLAGSELLTGNALIEPNECNQLNITLSNTGTTTATAVNAVLSTNTPNVTITQPNAAFADIPAGQSRTSLTPFEISTSNATVCFTDIDLDLSVTYGGGGSPFTDTLTLPVGEAATGNYAFTASSGATIPAGGTLIVGSNQDDALVNVTVPAGFNFSLYGNVINGGTTLRASTNGTLQFIATGGSRQYDNSALPSNGTGNFAGESFPASSPVMMPYWFDMILTASGGGIYTNLVGTAPNRQFIVEWRGQQYAAGATSINTVFAIVFNELSNNFEYRYTQTGTGGTANGAGSTIGLQAATTGSMFTQYSLNTASVTPGTRLSASIPTATCTAGSGACGVSAGVLITESGGSTSVTEGAATDSYTVVLTTQPSADVQIALNPDADVSVAPSVLTFTALTWNLAQTVVVSAVNDRIVEGTHSGTITHSATGGGYSGVSINDVVASVTDNDSATYQFTVAGMNVTEAAGTIDVGVELSFGTTGTGSESLESAITIPVSVIAGSTATGGGVDYTLLSSSVIIPTDGTSQNLSIDIVDDALSETTEEIVLSLGSETGGTAAQQQVVTGGVPSVHTVSITDNDSPGVTISESGGSSNVTEGGAGDDYTLVLNSQPSADVVITITPDAQLEVAPTSLTFTAVNWATPQTVAISAVDDAVDEGNHTGSISHSAAGGGYDGVGIAAVSVSIIDNDLQADLAIGNIVTPASALPGEQVTFEVTINNLSTVNDVPSAAFDFSVVPALDNPQWTCVPDATASCPSSGSGLPSHSVGMATESGVMYTITADVPLGSAPGTMYVATAQISVSEPITDPNPSNDSAEATVTTSPVEIFADGFESP